jgi:hypothetical protein
MRSAAAAAAAAAGSPPIATTSMPAIDVGALFIGREEREGNNGSGVTTEEDDGASGSTLAISWRSRSANFGRGFSGGGSRRQ